MSRSSIAMAMLASTVIASPFSIIPREFPLLGQCIYFDTVALNATAPGTYECESASVPDTTPYYGTLLGTSYPNLQLVYTQDQTCPPRGPGAVFATLVDKPGCVQFNQGGNTPGLSVFPHGGAEVTKKVKLAKRDTKCNGFNIESQEPSETESVQVFNIINCINGVEGAGCVISKGEQHTESVSTSYSVTTGGGIEGLFMVSATFGMDYTESETTTIEEGFTIAKGQRGYLAAYSAATLFKGMYTGCDSGDDEQPGEALVVKKGGFTYGVIHTDA